MKVKIVTDPYDGIIEILFCNVDHEGRITHIVKPVDLIFEEYVRGSGNRIEPTIKLDTYGLSGGAEFIESLASELESMGIKTSKDAKESGQLEAIKYHLEDLRSLLELDKKEKK